MGGVGTDYATNRRVDCMVAATKRLSVTPEIFISSVDELSVFPIYHGKLLTRAFDCAYQRLRVCR